MPTTRITRRRLLEGAAAGAAVGALPATVFAKRPKRADVVVVGAGISGLAAAHAIRKAGHSVVVLEARGGVRPPDARRLDRRERLDAARAHDRQRSGGGHLGRRAQRAVAALRPGLHRWSNEQWTRGCPVGHIAPGVLHRHGARLRTPHGRVHFAGTETADYWNGYMDGGVRAGERAAGEVLKALRRR